MTPGMTMNILKLVTPVASKYGFHVGQGLIVEGRDDHMRADIDAGPACPCLPVVEPGDDAAPVGLLGEVHQRRGAAERGRNRPALEGVDGHRRTDLGLQVRVHVDAARENQQAGRVMHVDILAGLEIQSDGMDPAVFDHHIGPVVVGRGNDTPALDQCSGHPPPPSSAGHAIFRPLSRIPSSACRSSAGTPRRSAAGPDPHGPPKSSR